MEKFSPEIKGYDTFFIDLTRVDNETIKIYIKSPLDEIQEQVHFRISPQDTQYALASINPRTRSIQQYPTVERQSISIYPIVNYGNELFGLLFGGRRGSLYFRRKSFARESLS